MCSRGPSAPPPPPEVKLPEAPQMPNVVAPGTLQAAPAAPKMSDATIKRKGKRGMVIQMGSTPGTNIPGV